MRWPSVSSFISSHLHHVGQDDAKLSIMCKAHIPILALLFPRAFPFLLFSGSVQRGSGIEEFKYLTPMPF